MEGKKHTNKQLRFMLFFLALGTIPAAKAGNDGFGVAPRSLGTGQISSLFTDVWAVHNNIGALGWLKRGAVSTSVENRYNNSNFNQISFAAANTPGKWGVVGFGASRFGSSLFNQTRAQLGWAKAFGIASIGIQGQWYQIQAAEFPSRHFLLLNFGGLAKLTPKISFAASIGNLTQTKASDFQTETLPTIAKAGISYTPNKSVLLLTEVQKDLDADAMVKAGIEYELIRNLWLRTGFTTGIMVATGGIGFKWRDLQIDYGVSHHPNLGWSNGIGLQFAIGKEKTAATGTQKTTDAEK